MAKCKLCSKKKWFFQLSKEGLCESCKPGFDLELRRGSRLMDTCVEAIENAEDIGIILANLNTGIEHFQTLFPYEERGIKCIKPPPSELAENWRAKKADVVVSHFKFQLDEVHEKVEKPTSLRDRTDPLSKIIEGLTKYQSELDDTSAVESLKAKIQAEINTVTANFHVEAAKNAER